MGHSITHASNRGRREEARGAFIGWWLQRVARFGTNRGRPRRPATINRSIAALRSYFRWAIEAGIIAANPAERVRPAKSVDHAPKWLEAVQIRRLRKAAQERIQLADLKGSEKPTAREARRDNAILAFPY
jgi:site-specific recombinase XerD